VEGDQTPPENPEPKSTDGRMDPSDTQGHDIEVKEQDRWLPIANGMCFSITPTPSILICALLQLALSKTISRAPHSTL
jgi:hypothetical protein